MRLTVRHETIHAYQPAAPQVALRLRLFPPGTATQRVLDWRVTVGGGDGEAPDGLEPWATDCWGESDALWFARRPTPEARVVAEGTFETEDRAGVIGRLGRGRPGVFLRQTRLTRPDAAIEALAAEVQGQPLQRLHDLNEAVADAIDYRTGATGVETTGSEALALGAGVCQDRAHVLIAAARILGLPARYVVGYLHDEAEPLAETHGWVEAWIDDLGWVGFDPTHRVSPTGAYVRLCSGLDAADAAPIRGSVQGAGVEQSLSVAVQVAQAQQ